jgi:hypothetical protein
MEREATKGPWEWPGDDEVFWDADGETVGFIVDPKNAPIIVSARNTLPPLIEALGLDK